MEHNESGLRFLIAEMRERDRKKIEGAQKQAAGVALPDDSAPLPGGIDLLRESSPPALSR